MRDPNYSVGPWVLHEVKSDSGNIVHLCPVDADGFSLLTIVEHDGTKFAAVYREADAQLIKSSPDIFEALKCILSTYVIPALGSNERIAYERGCTAIAKATTIKSTKGRD